MSKKIEFYKYSATGNDFILIESDGTLSFSKDEVSQICHRKEGIGSDGLLLFNPTVDDYDFEMIFYNPDGSRAQMCGNGARAMIDFASRYFSRAGEFYFLVGETAYIGHIEAGEISINMGKIKESRIDISDHLKNSELGITLDSGVPHAVIASNHFDHVDFVERARVIRSDNRFEQGSNIDIICFNKVTNSLKARVFERGVEGETDSSGTGATACATAAAILYKLPSQWKIDVIMKGGRLKISQDCHNDVWLSGTVTQTFQGTITL